MLRLVDPDELQPMPRLNLVQALDGVTRDVATAVSTWPQGEGRGVQHAPFARFAARADGSLVQVAGRTARSKAPQPAGATSVDGRLVYAVGDVHGCYDLLLGLVARLGGDASLAANGRRPLVIFLGDYVDRGPDSARVLQTLCLLKVNGTFDVCLLKGNHEQGLLQFIEEPDKGAGWIRHGGDATLRSYGVDAPEADSLPAAYETARDELLQRMPAAHLRLLQSLDLMVAIGGYVFVHAGVAPGEPLHRQKERDLLWIRREFLDAQTPFEKVVVHGHTWTTDRPAVSRARIGLDTGAYETGVLSAARIEDHGLETLHVRDANRPHWRDPNAPPPWSPVSHLLDFTTAPAPRILATLEPAPLQATPARAWSPLGR